VLRRIKHNKQSARIYSVDEGLRRVELDIQVQNKMKLIGLVFCLITRDHLIVQGLS